MDAGVLDMRWSLQASCIYSCLEETCEYPPNSRFTSHLSLNILSGYNDNSYVCSDAHNSNMSCRPANDPTIRAHKKMSQHRLLIFLRFLDNFVGDFVNRANKIADYHNNLIFRRIKKELFTSLREHFNYRMAPNPYSSDIVFTAFFLFNVLVQSVQKQNWNPITLPDRLTDIYSQRDAMKRLIMLCVKQYQEVGREPKRRQSGVPPNRYYRCLQPFFTNDAFIVSIVHTIQDHISMAIQTVTRYIEQRKAQVNEQKRTSDRRAASKTPKESNKVIGKMPECDVIPDTEEIGETNISPIALKNVHTTEIRSTSVDEFTPSGTQEFSETPAKADDYQYMFSASQDQADQWLTDYLQHTNSGFYIGDDFDLNDSYFLPIN